MTAVKAGEVEGTLKRLSPQCCCCFVLWPGCRADRRARESDGVGRRRRSVGPVPAHPARRRRRRRRSGAACRRGRHHRAVRRQARHLGEAELAQPRAGGDARARHAARGHADRDRGWRPRQIVAASDPVRALAEGARPALLRRRRQGAGCSCRRGVARRRPVDRPRRPRGAHREPRRRPPRDPRARSQSSRSTSTAGARSPSTTSTR